MRGSVPACAFVTVLLAGCTGLSQHPANAIDRDHARTQRVLAETRDGRAQVAESSDGVIVSGGIWLSGSPMRLAREGALPAVFSQPATFDREVGSLREFAEHVSRLSHIATRVAPDAAAGTGAGVGTSNGTATVTSSDTANTAVNSQLSVFNSLRASIQAMLSHYGQVVSSPATGSITVADTPDVLRKTVVQPHRVADDVRRKPAALERNWRFGQWQNGDGRFLHAS
ncbi:hypothetical protein [Burkholderia sp. Bp9140]|uniref:hypothetical protein n=1 Tax=Burkholderia sp. Bp9140 TaxID=2184572 RepID=UPI00162718E5|nr:hypothetical protein [Burkholderia sp. Bp9140]